MDVEHHHEPAELVLGPLLRYAGTESARFWVETSAPREVEILGHRAATFAVEGHHSSAWESGRNSWVKLPPALERHA